MSGESTATPPSFEPPRPVPPLTVEKAIETLWTCAWECVILAFLVKIMGSVTIGTVGGLWKQMIPSAPPGLAVRPPAEKEPSPTWDAVKTQFRRHRYGIVFAVLFVSQSAARLLAYPGDQTPLDWAFQAHHKRHRFLRKWFRLVVANAFIAFGLALALHFVQQFTLTAFLWRWMAGYINPILHAIANGVPGGTFVSGLVAWYDQNQLKFTFWLLYTGAICDDLGVPNYKTLSRWCAQRLIGPGAEENDEVPG